MLGPVCFLSSQHAVAPQGAKLAKCSCPALRMFLPCSIEVGPFRDNQPETGAFCRASLCPENVAARHFGTQSDSGFLTTTTFARLPSGALEFVEVELASSHSQPGTLMPLRAATARRPASKGGDRVHRPFKFAFCVATGKVIWELERFLRQLLQTDAGTFASVHTIASRSER